MPDQEPELPIARPARRPRRDDDYDRPHTERIGKVARAFLAIMALGLCVVFGIAAYLRPYNADGTPRNMATHTQLGMPPCNMVVQFGKPCPACGMTTSFSLLVHGDVWNSMKANWVGTILAIFWMGLIPWGLYGTLKGRLLWVRNGELFLTISIGVILALMMLRWGWILIW